MNNTVTEHQTYLGVLYTVYSTILIKLISQITETCKISEAKGTIHYFKLHIYIKNLKRKYIKNRINSIFCHKRRSNKNYNILNKKNSL